MQPGGKKADRSQIESSDRLLGATRSIGQVDFGTPPSNESFTGVPWILTQREPAILSFLPVAYPGISTGLVVRG